MNDNRVDTLLVSLGDFLDVIGIRCICKTLVVDDQIIALSPIVIVLQINLRRRSFATLIDNIPIRSHPVFL